ncbi:LPS export ABC transporter periplasmic protein LptC [Rasiella sp. SM2506]|uniref:LPS export ABC transporter periplasmic protein LptC n=1 Tax=Rasiella sp. SM2506 TaxID=3423914 RepID=UPI003D7AFD12
MINLPYIIKGVMAILFVITLFSCEGNYSNVQKLQQADNLPLGEGKGVNMKYTDSGVVVANLKAPVFLDFSNKEFPYKEFPEGVELYFWKEGKLNTVFSDYAIQYDKTSLIDLRENVIVVTSDSVVLRAEQLYWDQGKEWVFTDQPYQIQLKDGSVNNGASFDSNQDFTTFISRNNQGTQLIDKTKLEDDQ